MADDRTPKLHMNEIGETGLRRAGGFISEEFLPELSGRRGRETYRQMAENDPVIGGVIYLITTIARSVEWNVQPADDSEAAMEAAEFMESVMDDMEHSWQDAIADAISMVIYGFAVLEIVYKRRKGRKQKPDQTSKHDDGKVGVYRLSMRQQYSLDEWIFDDENSDVLGVVQTPDIGAQVRLPMHKCLHFKTRPAAGNPEGRSILRSAYRPWYLKTKIEELESIGVERDLAGIPVARIPSRLMMETASDEDKATLLNYRKLVRNIRRNKHDGLVLPSERDEKSNLIYDVELLGSPGQRQFDTGVIVERHNRMMAISALADFILMGHENVGSFALADNKTNVFARALGAFLDVIATEIEHKLVDQLWLYNGFDEEMKPKVTYGDIESPDLDKLGSYITALSGAGFILGGDRDTENFLREAGGMPPAPEEGEGMAGDEAGLREALAGILRGGQDGQGTGVGTSREGGTGSDPEGQGQKGGE